MYVARTMTLLSPSLKEIALVTSSYLHFVITPIVTLPEPAILILLGGGLFALAKLVRGVSATRVNETAIETEISFLG
jgi:hypothetical protein